MGTKDDLPRPSALALADDAAHGLARRMPELSAHKVITPAQIAVFLLAFASLAVFGFAAPATAWTTLVALTTAAFLAGTLFRAALACLSGAPAAAIAPFEGELPVYTILVPLYREANVLPRLARALLLLDYPGMLAQRVKQIAGPVHSLVAWPRYALSPRLKPSAPKSATR